MHIEMIHSLTISPKKAINIQKILAKNTFISKGPNPQKVKYIAAVDVSYEKKIDTSFAVIVIIKYPELTIVEQQYAIQQKPFPYIPGLLAFRELPSLIGAIQKVQNIPDIVFCDGHGIAHPRGIGIATHLGCFIKIPTIGFAKSRLCGEYNEPQNYKGAFEPLWYKGRIIGFVFRSRVNVKPIYISPGWGVDFSDVIYWADKLSIKYRIPIPIRYAHKYSNEIRLKYK